MTKPSLRDVDVPEDLLKMAARLPTQAVDATERDRTPKGRVESTKPLTVMVPERLKRQVEDAAHQERTTVRVVVMRALRQAGFDVTDDDLYVKRGRPSGS